MEDTQRAAIQESNRRRNLTCRKCGSMSLDVVDGSKCDGMPGLQYKVCGACGNAQAITKRQRKEKF